MPVQPQVQAGPVTATAPKRSSSPATALEPTATQIGLQPQLMDPMQAMSAPRRASSPALSVLSQQSQASAVAQPPSAMLSQGQKPPPKRVTIPPNPVIPPSSTAHEPPPHAVPAEIPALAPVAVPSPVPVTALPPVPVPTPQALVPLTVHVSSDTQTAHIMPPAAVRPPGTAAVIGVTPSNPVTAAAPLVVAPSQAPAPLVVSEPGVAVIGQIPVVQMPATSTATGQVVKKKGRFTLLKESPVLSLNPAGPAPAPTAVAAATAPASGPAPGVAAQPPMAEKRAGTKKGRFTVLQGESSTPAVAPNAAAPVGEAAAPTPGPPPPSGRPSRERTNSNCSAVSNTSALTETAAAPVVKKKGRFVLSTVTTPEVGVAGQLVAGVPYQTVVTTQTIQQGPNGQQLEGQPTSVTTTFSGPAMVVASTANMMPQQVVYTSMQPAVNHEGVPYGEAIGTTAQPTVTSIQMVPTIQQPMQQSAPGMGQLQYPQQSQPPQQQHQQEQPGHSPPQTQQKHEQRQQQPAQSHGQTQEKEKAINEAYQKPASRAGARNAAVGVAGRTGLGKVFYFLDQMRLEVSDAERTIKTMQTDMRLLVSMSELETQAAALDSSSPLGDRKRRTKSSRRRLEMLSAN